MKDENIVKGMQDRDEVYLEEMITAYGRLVYGVIYKIIADINPQVVEELVSDTFLDLWYKAEKIDLQRGSLKNLISLVARSKALNHRKMLMKEQCLLIPEDEESEVVDPESQLLEEENVQELLEIIREQKEPISTIFVMRYLYFYSINEIAEKLKMKRSQIDNHLSRGRKRLMEKLGNSMLIDKRGVKNEKCQRI